MNHPNTLQAGIDRAAANLTKSIVGYVRLGWTFEDAKRKALSASCLGEKLQSIAIDNAKTQLNLK